MSLEEATAYADRSRLYLSNAAAMFREGHPEKSSEMLWGGMAQALKAVAASKEIKLKSHRDIRNYARALAKERIDEKLQGAFSLTEMLHSNFYEGFTDAGSMLSHSKEIRASVETLLDLLPAHEEAQ